MEKLVTLYIDAEDYDRLASWRLAGWCKNQGANELTLTTLTVEGAEQDLFERFKKRTEPFRLPEATRRNLTAYGLKSGPEAFVRPTQLWRLNPASFAVLQELLPAGFFAYELADDGWFEDPAFYRDGEFMLGAVSHENEGVLRVTETERRLLEAEGFKFRPHGSYVGY